MPARATPVRLFFLAICVLIFCVCSFAQNLDPTFTPLLQDFGNTQNRASVHVSAVQPDGKILVGGNFTVAGGLARSGVARFNADLTPDPTFDAGNIKVYETLLSVTTGGSIDAIKVQPDGKIYIGGNYRREVDAVTRTIERLNPDGSLDTTFQSPAGIFPIADIEVQADGKVVIGGGFEISAVNPANGQTVLFKYLARLNTDGTLDFSFRPTALLNSNELVIQPDGKIVVGNAPTNGSPIQLIRYNPDGSTDAVLTNFDDWITGIELLPDGKFVVIGWFRVVNGINQKFIVRLNPDGTRDTSFASTVAFINALRFEDVAVQADGKVIVCGEFSSIQSDTIYYTRWRVARFNADGTMDQTFNTSTPISGVVSEVAPLADGKVFIGGTFPRPPVNEFYSNMGRMNADGSLDASAVTAYVVMEGEGYTIIQQPDGRVIVGGFFYYANDLRRRGIARYNVDGTLDLSFTPYTGLAYVIDMVLQPDGKIIVVNSDSPSSLFRLNPDGSRDTTFTDPFVPFSSSIQKRTRIGQIMLQPDGKLLVGGQLITGSATSPSLSGLARLNADGSRDTTFALVRALGGTINVHDIALQPDGKIIIGGDFTHINNNGAYHYVARISTDGTPDPTFFSPSIPASSPVVYEIERQADGKIVFAGNFNLVLRVNADGSADGSFTVPVSDIVKALAVQPNGKILVGGYFISINNVTRRRIARLNPDGSLDPTFDPQDGANNIVYDFYVQADTNILVVGAFTKVAGQERIGAARILDTVSLSGRVLSSTGRGVTGASVWLTDHNGVSLRVATNRRGYYRFEGLPTGVTYEIGVTSRRFQFESQTLTVLHEMAGVDFRGVLPARLNKSFSAPPSEKRLTYGNSYIEHIDQ